MNIVVGTQPVAHAPGPVVAAFIIAYSTSVPFTLSPGIESALPKKVKNFSQNPPHGNAADDDTDDEDSELDDDDDEDEEGARRWRPPKGNVGMLLFTVNSTLYTSFCKEVSCVALDIVTRGRLGLYRSCLPSIVVMLCMRY